MSLSQLFTILKVLRPFHLKAELYADTENLRIWELHLKQSLQLSKCFSLCTILN